MVQRYKFYKELKNFPPDLSGEPMKHQHLGGDKGGSPYRHSDEGDKMIEKCTVMLCHRDLIKSFAKIMQMSAMKACFQIAECSLSYAKIMQNSE